MEPRALDSRRLRTHGLVVVLLALAVCGQARAASLRHIQTDVLDNEGLTCCVIHLSAEATHACRDYLAEKNYLILDIYGIYPAAAERFITPAKGPVRQILVINRAASETQVLTLVFYLTDTHRYRIFAVRDPFRIVVDVFHGASANAAQELTTGATLPDSASRQAPGVPTRAAVGAAPRSPLPAPSSGKKVIILDPGHGGNDPGAVSSIKVGGKKVLEKDVTLAVAQEVKRLIDASPNMEALLTRDRDVYVSLGDRQNFCQRHSPPICANLFVSVHCNFSRARSARGLELYYLNPTGATRGSRRYLEEYENRNGQNQSPLNHPIFASLARESFQAWLTEGRVVCERFKAAAFQMPYYRGNGNRENTVQSAFFKVLFQADMPAVLVEVGFLTNATECQRLADAHFQRQMATALYNGIASYFRARDEQFVPNYLAMPAVP
ncbi:N-acetylmuramoyl-L-alanine amidase [Candidatus Sumerlaeota bacterium]|nr:N-acetylmuramoyl-L-alanine amidase [Candidatus Sumerlaeota bacterium]